MDKEHRIDLDNPNLSEDDLYMGTHDIRGNPLERDSSGWFKEPCRDDLYKEENEDNDFDEEQE